MLMRFILINGVGRVTTGEQTGEQRMAILRDLGVRIEHRGLLTGPV